MVLEGGIEVEVVFEGAAVLIGAEGDDTACETETEGEGAERVRERERVRLRVRK